MEIQQQKIKWVKTWQAAALSLKNVKRNELQALDYYEKNRIFLDEMLQYACDNSKKSLFSGLVEQQRIFKKFYKNKVVCKKNDEPISICAKLNPDRWD